MLHAQWGLGDRLMSDPAIWLCHQCNDCTVRCPRDAKPGDVMQIMRSMAVEGLAFPQFMGKLVAKAKSTWPLLIGFPFVLWIVLVALVNGFHAPEGELVWEEIVPHWLIYVVYIPTTLFVLIAAWRGSSRFWKTLGENGPKRQGSFFSHLIPVIFEILTHNRFSKCDTAKPRKWGHFALMWGFIGAAITTALIIFAMYVMQTPLPIPLAHPFKIIGNLSAILLLIGSGILLYNRTNSEVSGQSTAFDNFFLFIVISVGVTGVLTELGRLLIEPDIAIWLYILHLSSILCLFYTFPYSKFAHLVYRTLAMVHERMALAPKND